MHHTAMEIFYKNERFGGKCFVLCFFCELIRFFIAVS